MVAFERYVEEHVDMAVVVPHMTEPDVAHVEAHIPLAPRRPSDTEIARKPGEQVRSSE